MLTRDRIERFYEDVKALGLKFPVATIAKETKHAKPNVSRYLSGKLEPSEAFLDAFYKKFPASDIIVSREKMTTYSNNPPFQTKGESEKDRIIKSQEQHIRDLQQQIDFLKALLQDKIQKR